MGSSPLGRSYRAGEDLIRQGEVGDQMFVLQQGSAEVLVERDGQLTRVGTVTAGDIVGEMAVFEREVRSATVRALEPVMALTVDRKNLMRRLSEDSTLAFRLVQTLCQRIRSLNGELARLQAECSGGGDAAQEAESGSA
jgi:CRP-like cAMP-binding protein